MVLAHRSPTVFILGTTVSIVKSLGESESSISSQRSGVETVGPRFGAHGIDAGDRFPADVLEEVDVHGASRTRLHPSLDRGEFRKLLGDGRRDNFGDHPRAVVRHAVLER